MEKGGRVGRKWRCEKCTAECFHVEMVLQTDAVTMVACHRVAPSMGAFTSLHILQA